MKAKRVLLIGWDAADWKVIDQLIERGRMPALKGMIESGVRGNISTLDPPYSPMLWSSIATGKFADKHGIHGFTETDHSKGIIKPVTSTSRKARAIWNILTQQGKRGNVFGWWPSNPAEPINGIMVSNLYQRANKPINQPWPLMKGTVHPKDLSSHFASCRIHPDELTDQHILPFVPLAAKVDQDKDKRLAALSRTIADAATVHAASTWALEHTEWDFTAIYHDAIDHACHGFMKFRAPKLEPIPQDLHDTYKDVVDGMYEFHDMMLERTLQLVGPDTNVILISDHGFQSDHLRPVVLPKEPAAPALEHRKHGIICCMGPDFKQNQTVYGSSIIDIAPTLLTLFDLPIGEDMDGTPLLQLFDESMKVKFIPSWEEVKGDFGEHASKEEMTNEEASESIKQLVELGYIEDPGEDKRIALQKTETELQYNLARVYLSTDRVEEGLELLEKINTLQPDHRFQIRIADCYRRLRRFEDAMALLNEMEVNDTEQQRKSSIILAKAEVLRTRGEKQSALQLLVQLNAERPNMIPVLKALAECFAGLKHWKDAERACLHCLMIDPHDSISYKGLAEAQLRQGRYEEAVESALKATGLVFQYPIAHFILGEALLQLKQPTLAAQALELSLSMRPSFSAPRLMLEKLYKKYDLTREKVFEGMEGEHMASSALDSTFKKASSAKTPLPRIKGTITIVSGMPRSGTSLMMQMLHAGGMDVFTDGQREADENNPKGFYEHEAIKKSARQNAWVSRAAGKAAKVVSPLVRFLPPTHHYKVIVMKRDIQELVLSQHKMLLRAGRTTEDQYPLKLEITMRKQYDTVLAWMKVQPNFTLIEIDFEEAVAQSLVTAQKVNAFLGKDLDEAKMATVADENLYRNRK